MVIAKRFILIAIVLFGLVILFPLGKAFFQGLYSSEQLLEPSVKPSAKSSERPVVEKINNSRAGSYFKRGLTAFKQQDYAKADELFSEAISLSPENELAYRYRGICKFCLKQYDKAITDTKHALQIDPNDYTAMEYRGRAYFEQGEYRKAIDDFSDMLKKRSQYAYGFLLRGRAYYELAKRTDTKIFNKAIDDFNNAIKFGLKGSDVFNLRKNSYRNLENKGDENIGKDGNDDSGSLQTLADDDSDEATDDADSSAQANDRRAQDDQYNADDPGEARSDKDNASADAAGSNPDTSDSNSDTGEEPEVTILYGNEYNNSDNRSRSTYVETAQESDAPEDLNLSGSWSGLWGEDDVREVINLTKDSPDTFSGTSYFENRNDPSQFGNGIVTDGKISGRNVSFTLKRDNMEFHWNGQLGNDNRSLVGTFAGYSNNATYTR